ncbi:MAG: hypothetical protein N3A58_08270 [Spirochaetes bacterium]|nr:hypothetical protein [Spirochaetota bacterium]
MGRLKSILIFYYVSNFIKTILKFQILVFKDLNLFNLSSLSKLFKEDKLVFIFL